MRLWTENQDNRAVLKEIENKISELEQSIINGHLLSYQDSELLARKYENIVGEIKGLNFIKEKLEEQENDGN